MPQKRYSATAIGRASASPCGVSRAASRSARADSTRCPNRFDVVAVTDRRPLPASLLLLGLLLVAACRAPAAVPERIAQGQLLIVSHQPGVQATLEGRALRVDAAGRFLLAAGRDARAPLHLQLRLPDGRAEDHWIAVVARDWPVEHVSGVPPRTVDPPPEVAARIAREQAAVAAARQRDDARSDFAEGFRWPLSGRISGRFGSSRSYNGKPGSPHSGVDVAAPEGAALRAPAPGVVSYIGPDLYLTGGTVLIDHGHGLSSVFLHLSRIDVSPGQRLEAGEVFGAVGATGRATGPHMHWGLNWFDLRLDPEQAPGILGTRP